MNFSTRSFSDEAFQATGCLMPDRGRFMDRN
jgi:hypothetical protein